MTSEPASPGEDETQSPISIAREMIRAGQRDEAIEFLNERLSELSEADRSRAHNLIGLAFYYQGRYPEAFSWFTIAAQGSIVPETWFNVAMSQVHMGDPEGGLTTWQQVVDLSYSNSDAPETSTFFEKKLLFAEALVEAGLCDSRGLEILEQLVPFYLTNHITDTHFWVTRGVPAFQEVIQLMLRYYQGMKKSKADWDAFLDRVQRAVDAEGKEYVSEIRSQWDPLTPAELPPPPTAAFQ